MSVNTGGKPPDGFSPPTGAISGLGNTMVMETTENNGIVKTPKNNGFEKVKDRLLYELTDIGPYNIVIENNSQEFAGKLSAIKINEKIFYHHPELDNKIKEIESAGRNRVKVQCKDGKSANSLILSKKLENENLDVYIPKSFITRQGVISGVENDISIEFIKNKIKKFDEHCNFTVLNVIRIKKGIIDRDTKEKKIIETKSLIITFKTQILPKYVAIGRVRFAVRAYISRVMLCYNCYRYGHGSKQCKGKMRCLRCQGEHKLNDCKEDSLIKCFYCKDNHATNEIKKCAEFSKQKKIKETMSQKNIPFKEAEKMINRETYARIAAIDPRNDVDLSELDNTLYSFKYSQPQLNKSRSSTSSNFTQTVIPSKRNRPSSPNPLIKEHQNIISQFSLSQPGPSLLKDPIYQNNIQHNEGVNPIEVQNSKFNVNRMVDIIFAVLNILKQKNCFDINKKDLESILNRDVAFGSSFF